MTVDAPPLAHYGRITGSVFDLLDRGEVDLTAAVGWTLSASPTLMARLLELLGLEGPPDAVAVSLESADEAGRTDIELTSPSWKVVIEAKQGWLPDEIQLRKYVGRFAGFEGLLLTMSNSSVAWASHFPAEIDGVPVRHRLLGASRATGGPSRVGLARRRAL